MEIYDQLRANCDKLLEAYHTNLEDVQKLQETLIRDILPSVTDELNLAPDATEWAEEWLSDTASIFRIARKNKFTKSFTLEAIRKNLVWRLDNLWPIPDPVPMNNVHCISPDIALDPFGRPIVIVETVPLEVDVDVVKQGILQFFERVRINLYEIGRATDRGQDIPLQCIVLLDLKNLTFQRVGIDIMSWAIREVIPRFPGMLAGVFMLNYSWTHSGLWNVVKRILPSAALGRVFFPTQQETLQYFTALALPREYGGDLPDLAQLNAPEEGEGYPSHPSPQAGAGSQEVSLEDLPSTPLAAFISPTSLLNPFFGYPATSSPSGRNVPGLHHGRRRKRDLLRTLAFLWWNRWHSHIMFALCVSIAILLVKTRRRFPLFQWIARLKLPIRS
ncbi:hypothetical protein DFP72DRAFT_524255 [Ephemerocybe angulata]|uniref:CRAL-TRIO domain-containing protein n=1 Tax=Ephemerocybe angulata TaxID=980116 RepID=A0A8H6ICP9_9AGAR|nr:hypothetical protein DFP72DRAFT_524255 [Tulosesus angulatus]